MLAPLPRWAASRRRGRGRCQARNHMLITEAVKTVTSVAARVIFARDRQPRRPVGLGRVEGRVETGDVRHAGRQFPHLAQCVEAEGQMQRRQRPQLLQLVLNQVIDADGRDIFRAAMYDAMADASEARRPLSARRKPPGDEKLRLRQGGDGSGRHRCFAVHFQPRDRADPGNLPLQHRRQRLRREDCEFQRRGARIEDENIHLMRAPSHWCACTSPARGSDI